MKKKSNFSRDAEPPFNGRVEGSKPDGSFAVRRTRLRFSLVLMLCLALGLFACGDDDNGNGNGNGMPGVTLNQTMLTLTEGDSASYTIVLNSQPTANVILTLESSDTSALTLDTEPAMDGAQNTLTFTAANWNTARTVTLTAVEDADTDDESVTISHAVDMGATMDASYTALTGLASVMVSLVDNEILSRTTALNGMTVSGLSLTNFDNFGRSVAWLGDLDGAGDSAGVLAVGASFDATGGGDRGAVHLLFLNANGSVRSTTEINSSTTNGPTLTNNDNFGSSVAWLGDLDGAGDSAGVLAVGTTGDDTGGTKRGAVHLHFVR